jgi:hypothetical protein
VARNLLRVAGMHIIERITLASLVLLPVCPTIAPLATAATVEIADDDKSAAIGVADVGRHGDVVVGTLMNRGDEEVRDIRILIDMAFLWANEFKPGDDSPGRSAVMTVAGPIAPHGRLQFEFTPNPPLPARTDGRYAEPQVRVLGYQSIAAR